MDKRYLKVFELCFQSKSEARKQKEAGEAVGSSGVEQRRKMLKIQGTRRVGSTTRRVSSKIREDKDSVTYHVRELRDGLDELIFDSASWFESIKTAVQIDTRYSGTLGEKQAANQSQERSEERRYNLEFNSEGDLRQILIILLNLLFSIMVR